jgi:hypothetical protein
MDEETEKELTEHACELWAIRIVATELLADRLERSSDPKRAADAIIKKVYRSWEASSLPEFYRLKVPEHIASIVDDATTAALRRRRERGG